MNEIVPAVDIQLDPTDIEDALARVRDLLVSGRFSPGRTVQEFEMMFARFTGSGHAVACSSGTDALEMAFRAIRMTGHGVLVPANTNFATFAAAERAGATAHLVDIDPDTLSPTVEILRRADLRDIGALALVHMGGIMSPETADIVVWCRDRGISVIEDCAHAHGSRLNGKHAGTYGAAGAFSFFSTKVMTTGEGGMVVTDDTDLTEELRVVQNLGKRDKWISRHTVNGLNGRMSEHTAALGCAQMSRLADNVAARRDVAAMYVRHLGDLSARIVTPTHPYSGYKVVLMLPDGVPRNRFKAAMAAQGIGLQGEIYEIPLHQQPVLRERFTGASFPGAELSCGRQVCLPIYPTLTEDQVVAVCMAVREALTVTAAGAHGE